ncbi:DUF58 domain-containing protein [Marinobacterium weihaiense]|uniref:DUF58 domain-containing protein n=1 Tax=Marinobacterium weihaiense TaxID=2851016 RepID=A0ABS6M7T3_9GAMM|nr:DUF58 domain-containing protein [Marinobacterium weihaiense]MBV0932338.1 DUF58 domain-containing protein [Marinobacterium weihaiense]
MIRALPGLMPDRAMFKYLLILLGAALVLVGLRVLIPLDMAWPSGLWWSALGLGALVALVDALRICALPGPVAQRQLPGNLALGANARIRLRFDNPGARRLRFSCMDDYPAAVTTEQLPVALELPPGERQVVEYSARPVRRGTARFGDIRLRIRSPLGLWQLQRAVAAEQAVKVYPNFMALANLNFLDYEQRLSHIGAHLSQRRGSGQEFKQLREYQRGDEIRQIDWKATARQQRLVSREYQDERDQDVLFMLDTGRRMRAMDGELSHFDHSLNALLLTAYIALGAGDAVGVLGYAGSSRWVRPVKGRQGVNVLLNSLYDVHSSTEASDVVQAAGALMQRQHKRALVILVTNLRDDDSDDLQAAVRLLSRKHLVMVACLRESCLEQTLSEDADVHETLDFCARTLYREQREQLIRRLQGVGVMTVDAVPQQLHVALIEQYLVLKRAGRL